MDLRDSNSKKYTQGLRRPFGVAGTAVSCAMAEPEYQWFLQPWTIKISTKTCQYTHQLYPLFSVISEVYKYCIDVLVQVRNPLLNFIS